MMQSHLYPGFQFAGRLQTIEYQRIIQKIIIRHFNPHDVLSIGCAQGDELEMLFDNENLAINDYNITAIDLYNVEKELCSKKFVRSLGSRFFWQQMDLLECDILHDYGQYDMVQCGFVLHDIPYELKDLALYILKRAVTSEGYIIVSDFFLTSANKYKAQISSLYEKFIHEAQQVQKRGSLSPWSYHQLVGDSTTPGIYRTKQDALHGDRDFLDDLSSFIKRVERMQLEICSIYSNPICPQAKVILLKPIQNNFLANSQTQQTYIYS
jgi:2-polyprenyl-3-methyl-5-hydroxy-6-metoxy-1,4-benzoquinol methylase